MADEKIIFSMNGVGKVLPHNNKVILKDIYLSFFYGAKIGIIGLNGSGKSTLMKIIAGVEKSYRGEVVWAPGYSVGYLEQEPQMDPNKTVIEVVQEGVQEVMDVLNEYNEISLKFMEPMDDDQMNALIERQGELSEKIEHLGGWEIDAKLERAMDALNCPPPDAKISTLSGGERRRVALCRLLLREPDVLLLDEPTNHLDISSCEALENALMNYDGTLFIISHDRYLINKLADRIYYLTPDGVKEYRGSYDAYALAAENAIQPKQEDKPAKSEKVNEYKLKKERESERRKLNTKVTRAEAEIEELDGLIEQKTNELSGLTDYQKAMELSNEIEELRSRQEQAMQIWEEASLALEEFGND